MQQHRLSWPLPRLCLPWLRPRPRLKERLHLERSLPRQLVARREKWSTRNWLIRTTRQRRRPCSRRLPPPPPPPPLRTKGMAKGTPGAVALPGMERPSNPQPSTTTHHHQRRDQRRRGRVKNNNCRRPLPCPRRRTWSRCRRLQRRTLARDHRRKSQPQPQKQPQPQPPQRRAFP